MATSERIFTNINTVDGVRQTALPIYPAFRKPVWVQVAIDLSLISICLIVATAIFKERIVWSAAGRSISPVLSAVLIVTTFVFSGVYPRQRTPLDIGEAEGLMRGISCLGVLLAIFTIGTHIRLSSQMLVTAAFIIVLLATQRECAHILRRHNAVPVVQEGPEFLTYSATGREGVGNAPESECPGAPVPIDPSRVLKRLMDILGAALLLVAALPLIAAFAVLIKVDSRGPVFIRQRRIGGYGVPFYMWKFRSMHAQVERYARSPISDADPRLTTFGRALRRSSIDELPQLLNVLKGEMSLVGPRPEMPFIVRGYLPYQRLRLNAVPGITGLWQISPARAAPIHENVHLDLFYINNQNVFLDLAILLRTVSAIFRGIGAI